MNIPSFESLFPRLFRASESCRRAQHLHSLEDFLEKATLNPTCTVTLTVAVHLPEPDRQDGGGGTFFSPSLFTVPVLMHNSWAEITFCQELPNKTKIFYAQHLQPNATGNASIAGNFAATNQAATLKMQHPGLTFQVIPHSGTFFKTD